MSKIDNVTQETKSLSLFHLLTLLLLITFTTSCLRLRDGSADWIIPLGTKRRLEHRQWRELAKRIHTVTADNNKNESSPPNNEKINKQNVFYIKPSLTVLVDCSNRCAIAKRFLESVRS